MLHCSQAVWLWPARLHAVPLPRTGRPGWRPILSVPVFPRKLFILPFFLELLFTGCRTWADRCLPYSLRGRLSGPPYKTCGRCLFSPTTFKIFFSPLVFRDLVLTCLCVISFPVFGRPRIGRCFWLIISGESSQILLTGLPLPLGTLLHLHLDLAVPQLTEDPFLIWGSFSFSFILEGSRRTVVCIDSCIPNFCW